MTTPETQLSAVKCLKIHFLTQLGYETTLHSPPSNHKTFRMLYILLSKSGYVGKSNLMNSNNVPFETETKSSGGHLVPGNGGCPLNHYVIFSLELFNNT